MEEDRQAQDGMSTVDWAEVGERLVAYALWVASHRLGRCRRWDDIGLGRSPEDLAREVISDLLLGRCQFDPAKGGALVVFLKQRLRWRLLNLWSSAAHRREERLAELPASCSAADGMEARRRLKDLARRVDEHMGERKRKFDLRRLLEAIQGDPEASPQDLAVRLGVDRDQVYYQLRLLRRLALGQEAEEG